MNKNYARMAVMLNGVNYHDLQSVQGHFKGFGLYGNSISSVKYLVNEMWKMKPDPSLIINMTPTV